MLPQNKRFEKKAKNDEKNILFISNDEIVAKTSVLLSPLPFLINVLQKAVQFHGIARFSFWHARTHHEHNVFPLQRVFVCALSTDLCYMPLRAWKVYILCKHIAAAILLLLLFHSFFFCAIIQLALSIHWLPHIYTECFHSDILQYFSFFLSSIFRFRANSLAKAHWNVQKKWCYSLFIHWWRFSEQKKCESREKPPNAMAKKTECT